MLPRCPFAQSYHAIMHESIRLPDEISPELLARVLERLSLLRSQLEQRMSPFHFPQASGTHYCLRDAYEEGVLRVQNLAAFPLPKPAPRPKRRSLADVLKRYEAVTETSVGDREEDEAHGAAAGNPG